MNAFLRKIQKKLRNIQQFGIIYEVENLKLRFGLTKNRSMKSVKKIENFYRTLDPQEYPEQLKEWYLNENNRELNLENPTRFTEKIQWLKLFDSTEIKTKLADKYLARDWVAEKIGEEHLIPLLGAWDSFDEIDLDELMVANGKYDIDHIYPRHFIKDDSLENNLVLVNKNSNAYKSDDYPLTLQTQSSMKEDT